MPPLNVNVRKIRKRRALFGELAKDGAKPIYGYVVGDQLHFHKLGDRYDPDPICLVTLCKKAYGILV